MCELRWMFFVVNKNSLSLSLYISFFFGATHVLVLAVLVDIYAERSNKLHMCKWYLMLEFFPDALDFAKTHW